MTGVKDLLALRTLCLQDTQSLVMSLGDYDSKLGFSFVDRRSNVLAVAHVDTVSDSGYPARWKTEKVNFEAFLLPSRKKAKKMGLSHMPSSFPTTMVRSISLDDRLGIHIIRDLLPRYGVKPDVLYTTDEEFAASTARDFLPSHDYNWIFSFDRRGTNVVMYQYETQEHASLLENHGYTLEHGSYSDIRDLDHLGVTGFNFGTGSGWEHTKHCNVSLDVVTAVSRRFAGFYREHYNTHMSYVPKHPQARHSYGVGRSTWDYGEYDLYDSSTVSYDPGGMNMRLCSYCGIWHSSEDLTPLGSYGDMVCLDCGSIWEGL